jgi:hypothetical protein
MCPVPGPIGVMRRSPNPVVLTPREAVPNGRGQGQALLAHRDVTAAVPSGYCPCEAPGSEAPATTGSPPSVRTPLPGTASIE